MQVSGDHQSAGAKAPGAGLGSRSDLIYCRHYIVWIGVRKQPSCLLSGLMFMRSIHFHEEAVQWQAVAVSVLTFRARV